MKALHILDHYLPHFSGYTFRSQYVLQNQAQVLGVEPVVLTSLKQGDSAESKTEIGGIRIYRTAGAGNPPAWAKLPVMREYWQMRTLEKRILEVAALEKPQVLHAHSPVLNAWPALWAGRKLGIPVVYEIRAFWEDAAVDHGTSAEWGLRYRLTRAMETYAIKNVNAVTTICEGLRRDIIQRGIPSDKVTVIPNAVNIEDFSVGELADAQLAQELGLDGKVVLGFIGSFYAYEGLDVLLKALPAMLAINPDIRLLLVGGGPQDQALKEQAAHLGVADKIKFTGRVPHEQVQRYYNLADVLVYPRLRMRLTELVTPLKPLEAMAQGRLLVASDVGGHGELIEDDKTGVLFKADDPQALASKVLELIAKPERWTALRIAARQYVENERNWPVSVARYKKVYSKLSAAKID